MSYVETNIWIGALGNVPEDTHEKPRARLRSAYSQFWDNACELARQIGKDVPNLTLHDDRHFNALWHRADQILGGSDPLTPVEAFVLGAAILLHDAANCVAAYEGGMPEIESTPEWKDEITTQLAGGAARSVTEDERYNASADDRATALFNVLRQLHAKRAEDLAFLSLHNESANQRTHLLQDDSLRNHLGRIIGLIAASHHWNIQDLPRRLPKIVGALAGFPSDWIVRPVRIACLLRCADACQLDQTRAPDFLYALLQLKGLSELHWRAQNRLLAPVVDPDDTTALIFTSSADFGPDDADAWWIAYDAIQVANRELQDSHVLLKDTRQKPFQISRIRDADSAVRLSQHVAIRGWRPVTSEVKVSNVSAVVQMFGGEQLYGRDYLVPLRETLQNAADAIRQRRALPGEQNYSGEIVVKLKRVDSDMPFVVIEIYDDGIGMSEDVMTGHLIDFGSSYVGSALAKTERPGLFSRQAARVGRFGVGFFSVFMVSQAVSVTSRPFDRALTDAKTLLFRSGFTLRPLLLDAAEGLPSPLVSTKLSLQIPADKFVKMATVDFDYLNKTQVEFRDIISFVCPCLDCDVYYEDEENDRQLVHSRYWHEGSKEDWLDSVALRPYRAGSFGIGDANALERLQLISPHEPRDGMAAISVEHNYAGIRTIGGLITTSRSAGSRFEYEFVGTLDAAARGPRRDAAGYDFDGKVASWASDQALALGEMELTLIEAHHAAVRVGRFGGDPSPVIQVQIRRKPTKFLKLVEFLVGGGQVVVPVSDQARSDDVLEVSRLRMLFEASALYSEAEMRSFKDNELEFLADVLESPLDERYWAGALYEIPICHDAEPTAGSLLDCLTTAVDANGLSLVRTDLGEIALARYVGESSARDQLETGSELVRAAYSLRAERR